MSSLPVTLWRNINHIRKKSIINLKSQADLIGVVGMLLDVIASAIPGDLDNLGGFRLLVVVDQFQLKYHAGVVGMASFYSRGRYQTSYGVANALL